MQNNSTTGTRQRFPNNITGWTLSIFGFLAFVLGLVGLISPDTQLKMMGFEQITHRTLGDYTPVVMASTSIAATYTGILYILSAIKGWIWFPAFTIGARLFMGIGLFSLVCRGMAPNSFIGAAIWEGAGALITALGLLLDYRRSLASTLKNKG